MSDVQLAPSHGSKLGLWIKRGLVFGLPVLVILVTAGSLSVMGSMAPKPEKKEDIIEALPVLTANARTEPLSLTVSSQGEVVARSQVDLAPEVSGRVSYVSDQFVAGGQFRNGDVLVQIDPTEYELRVVQARANVAQAQTILQREQSEARNARIDADELGLGDVSDLALREPQVAEAEARLASAKASLSESELKLSRTKIRAPFDGRMISRTIDRGAFVSVGMTVAEIFASDVVEIPIALTDDDLDVLGLPIGYEAKGADKGPEVRLSAIVAGDLREWTGHIRRTASGFDPETRVLFAYVEVQDPFDKGSDNGVPLATGLFVSAEIKGPSVSDALIIPRTALRGKDTVYVVENGNTLTFRTVRVSSSDRERAVISDGLEAGEVLITSPVRGPADGMTVRPVQKRDDAGDGSSVLAAADNTQLKD